MHLMFDLCNRILFVLCPQPLRTIIVWDEIQLEISLLWDQKKVKTQGIHSSDVYTQDVPLSAANFIAGPTLHRYSCVWRVS